MMSNSVRHASAQPQMIRTQFNDPMAHNPGMMQHGNLPSGVMPSASMNFLQPNAGPPADNQPIKSLQPANMPPPNTISLAMLIDFVVYKTYHDITVMADILPSKSDIERKTTIVEFSTRVRQLFIRLFSLVKWASSVGKVVRCSEGSTFLDHQAMVFVDTADKLHILANQLVVQARLPNFSIPAAVDVLTTGTYIRLPLCIRDRIIPPDSIKPKEKKAALKRIDQIMLYRLATEYIPPQIFEVKVDRGVVHLHVPNEFKVYMTLMGDKPHIPWRVLKLEFLVDDLDVGNGRSLIHHLQVDYIHELVQSRLINNEKPLKDLYDLLHSFCLSLQLEVLHEQANRLMRLRWGKFIQLDEYQPGQRMTVSYWRLHPYKTQTSPFSITICQSPDDSSKPLQVLHNPKLSLGDVDLSQSCSHIDNLSLECLIHRSICMRSFHLLTEVKQLLHKHIRHDQSHFSKEDSDRHSILFIPLLDPGREAECLRILVDPQTGSLQPFLDAVSDAVLEKMEKEINDSTSSLLSWFTTLRDNLAMQRCRRAVQLFPVVCLDRLLYVQDGTPTFGDNCLFIKMLRHPFYYLVVEIIPDENRPTQVSHQYHLLATASVEKKSEDGSPARTELVATSVHNLMAQLTSVDHNFVQTRKNRASRLKNLDEIELQHMVAVCCSHIPFIDLISGMDRMGVEHQGIDEGGSGIDLSCSILTLPNISGLGADVNALLCDALLRCTFRLLDRANKIWVVELMMRASPVKGAVAKNNGSIVPVTFNYDATSHLQHSANRNVARAFLDDWAGVGHLYGAVYVFAEQMKHPGFSLGRSIKVHTYNYKSITIKYGKSLSMFVTIMWSKDKQFVLRFGRLGQQTNSNAHCLVRHYLTEKFNASPDISSLMHTLCDSSTPLHALARLPSTPLLGVYQKATSVEQTFTIVPQTATHVRITFLSAYCLDVYFRSDGVVMVRDGAFSQFDFAKSKYSLIPIPGLATFLSKCKDPRHIRRHADSEKDNPPSPTTAPTSNSPPGSLQNFGLQSLPHASYSAANFTILPHASLATLCEPPINPTRFLHPYLHRACPLEQFLGAALTRRFLNKCISNTENVRNIMMAQDNSDGADGALASAFVARSLQVACQPLLQDMRQLKLKVQPIAISSQMENWPEDDLRILENFFEDRITSSPYRYNAMRSFFNMISAPAPVLRDLIQLMRIEMMGGRMPGFNLKWTMSLCLTSSPRVVIAPIGTPCIIVKDKVLVFIQLTQVQPPHVSQGNPHTILVPLLHEPPKNAVNILAAALQPKNPAAPALQYINKLLIHLADNNRQNGPHEATVATAVRYLMENLAFPT